MVHDHHGSKVLPQKLKQTIINRLNTVESKYLPNQWKRDRDMVVKHLLNTLSVEQEWIDFWSELKQRDAIRKESFEETFPEYFEEIKNLI